MQIIMPQQAHAMIEGTHGKIFSVTFRRKNDKIERKNGVKVVVAKAGDLRRMNCRTEAHNKRKTKDGEGRAYSFDAKRLVSVYDLQVGGFRSFSWENVVTAKIGGEYYIVLSEQTLDFCRHNPESSIAKEVAESGIGIEVGA